MKHLFLAESDYAACGAAFALALQSAGEECRYLAARRHIYKYPHQTQFIDPQRASEQLSGAVAWADWIWLVQSDLPSVMGGTYGGNIGFHPQRDAWKGVLRSKKLALLHGGGHYRDYREFYADCWGPFEPLSICYEADLMGSFANEHLVIPPLNPLWVPQDERNWNGLRVGHFPSRPTDKGSEWIIPLCEKFPFELRSNVTNPNHEDGVDRITWEGQLDRIADCDVVIDQIKPELNGKPFGEWVSLATETAMCGRIPITNSRNPQPYVDTYGRMPGIHICNDAEALSKELDRLCALPEPALRKEQRECRHWAEQCHSLRPTGRLLLRLCQ